MSYRTKGAQELSRGPLAGGERYVSWQLALVAP